MSRFSSLKTYSISNRIQILNENNKFKVRLGTVELIGLAKVIGVYLDIF